MNATTTACSNGATFRMPEVAVHGDASLYRLRSVGSVAADDDRRVAVDLSRARFLPSGFLEVLLEWRETGIEVLLLRPRPHVRAMIWFRLFAREAGAGVWRMTDQPAFQFPCALPPGAEAAGSGGRRRSCGFAPFGSERREPALSDTLAQRRPR